MHHEDNYEDPIKKAKKEVERRGFPAYINSDYCVYFVKTHKNCEQCEYNFACDKVLEQTIRNEIDELRNAFLEDEQILLEDKEMKSIFDKAKKICKPYFKSSECFQNCNVCQYLGQCNLFFSMIFGFFLKNVKN